MAGFLTPQPNVIPSAEVTPPKPSIKNLIIDFVPAKEKLNEDDGVGDSDTWTLGEDGTKEEKRYLRYSHAVPPPTNYAPNSLTRSTTYT
jgi:hypothetical protein